VNISVENNRLAISATELMARIGISRSTLQRLVKEGALTPVPQIRKRIFSLQQVTDFLSGKKK
jgi:DNA-binding Xre family transcriptional regulator